MAGRRHITPKAWRNNTEADVHIQRSVCDSVRWERCAGAGSQSVF